MRAPGNGELHTLVGAYVMDAVSDTERTRFSRHLASCQECRAEIRELHEAAARLGTATAVLPRPELKDQTIRAASRISQFPPARRSAGRLARRALAEPAHPGGGGRGSGRRWPRAGWSRLALAASAALAACAVALGVLTQDTMRQLDHSQRQAHLIAAVLNAPDVVMLTAAIRTGGTATVVMSHRRRALVFTAHGLRQLPAAQAYELWLMGPDGTTPSGLLTTAGGGMAGPAIVSGLAPGEMVGLTVEPAAGSRQPTSPPIVLIVPRK